MSGTPKSRALAAGQVVADVGHVILQEARALDAALQPDRHGGSVAVDVHQPLLYLPIRVLDGGRGPPKMRLRQDRGIDADAREGVPFLEDGREAQHLDPVLDEQRPDASLDVADVVDQGEAGQPGQDEVPALQEHRQDGRRHCLAAEAGTRKEQAGGGGDHRDHQDAGRPVRDIEEAEGAETAGRGAGEVGAVDAPDRQRALRERDADDDA
jgi:hypothetical protein